MGVLNSRFLILARIKAHSKLSAQSVILILLLFFFLSSTYNSYSNEEGSKLLTKYEIYRARYGTIEEIRRRAKFLQISYKDDVVGQDAVIESLQLRVLNYLEMWGRLSGEPVSAHLIGLPGIGKSLILDNLGENIEIQTYKIDAQTFVNPTVEDVSNLHAFFAALSEESTKKPVILIIEELDKIREIGEKSGSSPATAKTNPFIGVVNQILTNGEFNTGFMRVSLSNVLVVTSMNLPEDEIGEFAKSLGDGERVKDFYDFTVDDFVEFINFLKDDPQAVGKILSRMFRFNTVSRIVPNALIVEPLTLEQHREISNLVIDKEVARLHEQKNVAVTLTISKKLREFIADTSINAPTGARSTVIITRRLIQQIILGALELGKKSDSFVRPRRVTADFDATGRLVIEIVPQKRSKQNGKTVYIDDAKELFTIAFDHSGKNFLAASELAKAESKKNSPPYPAKLKEKKLTNKGAIKKRRFGEGKGNHFPGLANELNNRIFGQEEITRAIESDLNDLWSSKSSDRSEPVARILAGFPGIGKSDLIQQTAEITGIPVVKFNMQGYAGSDTANSFFNDLIYAESSARSKSMEAGKNGRIILLIEEIDKIHEVDPQTGKVVNRPIIGIVKELINSGRYTAQIGRTIDLRSAYIVCTMNFGADLFGFEADPSLTSIEDVTSVWKKLKKSTLSLQRVLSMLFLPETVNRFLSKILILKPLDKNDYFKLIEKIRKEFEERRFGKQNLYVRIELTASYKEYILQDTTIPSEGARNTIRMAGERIQGDTERGYSKIKRTSELASQPFIITLDYIPESNEVRIYAMPDYEHPLLKGKMSKENAEKNKILLDTKRPVLNFPSKRITGPIPERRMMVSVHEFGHAFSAVTLGIRFKDIVVETNKTEAAGYVSFPDIASIPSARELFGRVYVALGSRAMERIFYSQNPLDPKSVYGVSSGASNDIFQATNLLITLIHQLGLSPYDGTGNWSAGLEQAGQKIPDLPESERTRITEILREMENHLVRELLAAHPREWYLERIENVAVEGHLSEKQFYEFIGYKHASGNTQLHDPDRNRGVESKVSPFSEETRNAMDAKNGDTQKTARENMDSAMELVDKLLKDGSSNPDTDKAADKKTRALSFKSVVGSELTVDEFLQALGLEDGYIHEYKGGKRVVANVGIEQLDGYLKGVALRSIAIIVTDGEKRLLRVGTRVYDQETGKVVEASNFYRDRLKSSEIVIFADENTISETQELIESRGFNVDLRPFGVKSNGNPMGLVKANFQNPMVDIITLFNCDISTFVNESRSDTNEIKTTGGRKFNISKERLVEVRRMMVEKMLRRGK